jgi:CARDB
MKVPRWFTLNRIGTAGAFVSAAVALALLAAGCPGPPPPSLPDLVVEAPQGTSGYTCDNGKLSFTVHAVITNKGPADATLPAEWTKPWVTAYPSKPAPNFNFVQPYQTGGHVVTLKKGESTSVDFPVILGRSEGGAAYDLIIQVDPYNVIQENNESNNTSNIAIAANICG